MRKKTEEINSIIEPKLINELLQDAATKYSKSPYTTNAGHILRIIAGIIPTNIIIQLFAHKLTK